MPRCQHDSDVGRNLGPATRGDLAGLLLRLEPVAVTKPTFKLVATGATQRK